MRFLLKILFLTWVFSSCGKSIEKTEPTFSKQDTVETSKNHNNNSFYLLKQNLTDSLIRHSDLPEFLIRDDSGRFVLYISQVNQEKIGVMAITDSALFLFKQINGHWTQTDSGLFKDYARLFEITDLNGDKNEDFLVYGFGNMHGQSRTYIFMSGMEEGLHYRSDIHLYNISYDPNKKLVRSFYRGGVYSTHQKELYSWVGDSLKLAEGVEHYRTMDGDAITTFYKLRNGMRYEYKIIKDSTEEIYSKALWKD